MINGAERTLDKGGLFSVDRIIDGPPCVVGSKGKGLVIASSSRASYVSAKGALTRLYPGLRINSIYVLSFSCAIFKESCVCLDNVSTL